MSVYGLSSRSKHLDQELNVLVITTLMHRVMHNIVHQLLDTKAIRSAGSVQDRFSSKFNLPEDVYLLYLQVW